MNGRTSSAGATLRKGYTLLVLLLLTGNFLVAQEICNNGIDDDGDGYIDCYDPDCSGNVLCNGSYIGLPTPACQFTPTPTTFTMALKWNTNGTAAPMDNRQTPVIGDWDNDGTPEVFGRRVNVANGLFVFDGATGNLEQTITSPATDVFLDSPTLGDIDSDGFGELVIVAEGVNANRRLYCYEHTGTLKWISNTAVGYSANDDRWAPSMIDFDGDGNPEVYCGNQIYNGQTGVRIASAGNGASRGASPVSINEALPVAADVLPTAFCADCGGAELICGNTVFSVNIGAGTMTARVVGAGVTDGPTSLGDIDQDGDIDAVVTGSSGGIGRVYVWDLQTSAQLAPNFPIQNATAATLGTTSGGRANIADFNNDGTPEIGLAGRSVYVVIDYNAGALTELWSRLTQDGSERTGSSVFDFEGDGANEVVYRDEDTLFVYDGTTGATKVSVPCNAATRYDYPVVTDVDADGQTDIICACDAIYQAYQSTANPWVKAREVWNQHAYYVVNIDDDLGIPRTQQPQTLGYPAGSPLRFPFNNFLTQTTELDINGLPTYAAADDSIAIVNTATDIDYTNCQSGLNTIGISPTVYNNGDVTLPAGTSISIYNGNPFAVGATRIFTTTLATSIPPGGNTQVPMFYFPDQGGSFTMYAIVNDDGSLALPMTGIGSTHAECDFSNNLFTFVFQDCGNNPPVIDSAGVPRDTLRFTLPENTANLICISATDPDNDPLDVTGSIGTPTQGALSGFNNSDTCFTYTTAFNQSGQQIFGILVCDNGNVQLCDTVWVVIDVFLVNETPIAVNDLATIPEDDSVLVNVLANDNDPDGDPLIVTIIGGPSNGTGTVIGNNVNYVPNANFNGTDTITYQICDNGVPPQACDTALIIVTVTSVNDAPVATPDPVNTGEDTPITVNVQNNDVDVDGDPLVTTIIGGPSNGSAVVLNGDSIAYTPNPNFNGTDTVVYVVCDNQIPALCDTSFVIINVATINDPPVAVDDSVNTNEDTPLAINVQGNDTDPDNDPLTTTILNGPTNGTANVVNGDSIVYTPNLNFFGTDTITYVICDNGLPPQECDTAVVVIVVDPINDPPVATNDTTNVPNDTSGVVIPVTLNDFDAENGASLTAIVCGPVTGSAMIVGDSISYMPDSSFIGLDSICYTYCDAQFCDTAVVYINVAPSNLNPLAQNDADTTTHNDLISLMVLANDTDPNGDSLTVTAIICGPDNGTATVTGVGIDYTPNAGFLGLDSICYVVCDVPPAGTPFCDTAVVFITVVSDNIAPIGQDDNDTTTHNDPVVVSVLDNDIDPDNTVPLSATNLLCPPTQGMATLDQLANTITYTPDSGFLGLDSLCYVVCDNGVPPLCDTTTVYLLVISDNLPPIAVTDQGTAGVDMSIALDVLVNDSDPENGILTVSIIIPPANGSLLQNGSTVTYTPIQGFVGTDSMLYEICDNGVPIRCDSAWVYFTINTVGISPPVGFSPNNDGDNETWVVDGLSAFPNNRVQIFSRWGDQVFEATDYQNDWDGTYNGNALPEGTYYWVIDLGDGTEIQKGFVVLFR